MVTTRKRFEKEGRSPAFRSPKSSTSAVTPIRSVATVVKKPASKDKTERISKSTTKKPKKSRHSNDEDLIPEQIKMRPLDVEDGEKVDASPTKERLESAGSIQKKKRKISAGVAVVEATAAAVGDQDEEEYDSNDDEDLDSERVHNTEDENEGKRKKKEKKSEEKQKQEEREQIIDLTSKEDKNDVGRDNQKKKNDLFQLDEKQVAKAVKALLKHHRLESQKRTSLLDDQQTLTIFLQLSFKNIPKGGNKPKHISLVHSFYIPGQSEICLIVRDPQRETKDRLQDDAAGVTKVLGLEKLRNRYKTHESRRELCMQYDQFLADARIVRYLPPLLGKTFVERKKLPHKVDLERGNIQQQIAKARDATTMMLRGGAIVSIRVGVTSWEEKMVLENILHVVKQMEDPLFPGGKRNIRALHVKTEKSVALPIYRSMLEPETAYL